MENYQSNYQYSASVFFNNCLRYILRFWWPKIKISNVDLWKLMKQQQVHNETKARKWGLIGHTQRKNRSNIASTALEYMGEQSVRLLVVTVSCLCVNRRPRQRLLLLPLLLYPRASVRCVLQFDESFLLQCENVREWGAVGERIPLCQTLPFPCC